MREEEQPSDELELLLKQRSSLRLEHLLRMLRRLGDEKREGKRELDAAGHTTRHDGESNI